MDDGMRARLERAINQGVGGPRMVLETTRPMRSADDEVVIGYDPTADNRELMLRYGRGSGGALLRWLVHAVVDPGILNRLYLRVVSAASFPFYQKLESACMCSQAGFNVLKLVSSLCFLVPCSVMCLVPPQRKSNLTLGMICAGSGAKLLLSVSHNVLSLTTARV